MFGKRSEGAQWESWVAALLFVIVGEELGGCWGALQLHSLRVLSLLFEQGELSRQGGENPNPEPSLWFT